MDIRQKVQIIEDKLAVGKALREEKKLEEAFEAYGVAVGMVKSAMKTSSLSKLNSLLQQAIIDGGGLLYHIVVSHDVFARKVKIRGFQPTFSKFFFSQIRGLRHVGVAAARDIADVLEARAELEEGNLDRAKSLLAHHFAAPRCARRVREMCTAIERIEGGE